MAQTRWIKSWKVHDKTQRTVSIDESGEFKCTCPTWNRRKNQCRHITLVRDVFIPKEKRETLINMSELVFYAIQRSSFDYVRDAFSKTEEDESVFKKYLELLDNDEHLKDSTWGCAFTFRDFCAFPNTGKRDTPYSDEKEEVAQFFFKFARSGGGNGVDSVFGHVTAGSDTWFSKPWFANCCNPTHSYEEYINFLRHYAKNIPQLLDLYIEHALRKDIQRMVNAHRIEQPRLDFSTKLKVTGDSDCELRLPPTKSDLPEDWISEVNGVLSESMPNFDAYLMENYLKWFAGFEN